MLDVVAVVVVVVVATAVVVAAVAVVAAAVVVAVVVAVVAVAVVVDLILLVTQTKTCKIKSSPKSPCTKKNKKLFSPRISGVDSFSGSFRFLWSLHNWNKS